MASDPSKKLTQRLATAIIRREYAHVGEGALTEVTANLPSAQGPTSNLTDSDGTREMVAMSATTLLFPQVSKPVENPIQKKPGDEPLPGYTLIRPLGRGGFGEVWQCEAPGGLLKAIKYVRGASDSAGRKLRQEYEAFEQVKAIRHPFLLGFDRVELVGEELVMVMDLADRHIGERFAECRAKGLPGIPRGELIGYLREAAEALDVIGAQYRLQHLDVKPANLLLTAGHLQVADYGLVSKLGGATAGGKGRGLTPMYAAPEVLRGVVHTQSDQYSLSLVYQEMLTGCFPYSGKTPKQMMKQHLAAEPDLSALPASDRAAVAKGLSKSPERRFASCLEFIEALATSKKVN